jgi:hypothetical protein
MKKRICRGFEQRIQFQYLLFLSLAFASVSHADTDVVIFSNGDRLTGEIKSLERGQLRFKTDATGTINIEWDDIASIESDQNIQVETVSGIRYLGHLALSENESSVVVETTIGPRELEHNKVVLMTPIEEKGVGRLDGDITAGYNFTKASDISQVQLGVDLSFRTELRIIGLEFDSTVTDSQDIEASERENLTGRYTRLWQNRWFVSGNVGLTRNDELGIDLRKSLGAGGGRYLAQTNRHILAWNGGLMYSVEDIAGSDTDEDSLEAYVGLDWDWFRFDSPELDLSTSVEVIPSLTESGRVRGEFDVKLKWEIINDLFWQLSFYESYDNKPSATGAQQTDYGVNTSLGWTF